MAVPPEILLPSPRPIPKGGGSGPEGRITSRGKALSLFLARSNQLNLPLVGPGTSWLTFEMLSPFQIQPTGAGAGENPWVLSQRYPERSRRGETTRSNLRQAASLARRDWIPRNSLVQPLSSKTEAGVLVVKIKPYINHIKSSGKTLARMSQP